MKKHNHNSRSGLVPILLPLVAVILACSLNLYAEENTTVNNGGFEDWNSGTTFGGPGWQYDGYTADFWYATCLYSGGSVSRESGASNKVSGSYSLKVDKNVGYGYGTRVYQQISSFSALAGQQVTFSIKIKSNAAVKAYIDDGVSTTYSTAHTGGNAFENLIVTKSVSAIATKVEVGFDQLGLPSVSYLDDGLVAIAPITYDLTITATSGGTTAPAPGTYTYSVGSSVNINAIPDANYSFDHWELDGSNVGSANLYSVLMNGDHMLHAVFIYELVPIVDTFTTVMESNTITWDTAGIFSPIVFYDTDADLYKMWYTAHSGPQYWPPYWVVRWVIAYAESDDGIIWGNKTVCHDTGGPSYYYTGEPWVLKENGTYRMWHMDRYEWIAGDWSSYIAHMSSSDGVSWPGFMSAGDVKVLSALGQSNPQGEGNSAWDSCVIYEPGVGYVMWYSVFDHPQTGVYGPCKIWRATSSDGVTWSNRQLSLPYVSGTWEGNIDHLSVVREDDGTYTMFYGAGEVQTWLGDTIGIAKSLDGVSWTNRTQLLKPSDLGTSITSISTPFHFQDLDGKRYLYFSYYDQGDEKYKFGRIQIGAYPQVTARFVIVDKERVGRTLFRYTCKVTLSNFSPDAVKNVVLELMEVPDNMTIIDSNVTFDYIEAWGSATSDDTCSFEVDRSQAIVPSEVIWQVTYEIADTGQAGQQMSSTMVQLEPISLAGDITGEGAVDLEDLKVLAEQWLQPPGTPSADIAPLPNGDGIVNFLDFAVLAENWLEGI